MVEFSNRQKYSLLFFAVLVIVFLSCNKEVGFLENEEFLKEEQSIALMEFTYQDCNNFSIQIDTAKRDRKVLIIGIDGFRSDAMQADIAPFLHALADDKNTFFTNKHQVEQYTTSGPNWSSILTGLHWTKHRVIHNNFLNNRLDEFPHFYKYLEEADSSIVTMSITHWVNINKQITQGYADYSNQIAVQDLEVYQQAKDILIDQDTINPDVLFLHFLDLDAAGHAHGFHPFIPEYASTLATIDGYVSGLMSIIEAKRKEGEDWMIFVVSDHGGEGKGHFTYKNENIKHTVFFANHPEEKFIQSYTSSQADLVPTIFDFMGIKSNEFDCKTDGISLIN